VIPDHGFDVFPLEMLMMSPPSIDRISSVTAKASGEVTRRTRAAGCLERSWVLAVAVLLVGCGTGAVREIRIPVRQQATAIDRCREYLEAYARGEPVGSEVIGFPQLIEDAVRENAELGEMLGRGLRDIEASMARPRDVAVKARAVLESLPSRPSGG